ncbi:MAG: glycosyltransferase [Candidatus Sumerlaeaceae bacterium]|nr:glycosyltransferase [Candidatus Sumerlaeaceae bacterium]
MSTILAIGTGPIFEPDVKVFNGQALRTWHIIRALAANGRSVDALILPVEGSQPDQPGGPFYLPGNRDGVDFQKVNSVDRTEMAVEFQKLVDSGIYNAMVAINLNAAAVVCQLETRLPMWVDLCGYTMGEAQAKCGVYQDDSYLRHFWARERLALRRGDRFSCVSFKQMYANLAELAVLGRLSQFNFSHPFCTVIPIAASEEFLNPANYPNERRYRGKLFPTDAFVIIWSGGFNTWTDARSLAGALSLAMEQEPRIHFVATGGAIPGHDEITYETFKSEMLKTGYLDRCHLLDWVEAQEIFALYREGDLGINIDSLNYETVFGARNRLTNMMAAGLPVLTTLGTEISEIIDENKLGYVVRIGRVNDYADALIRAAKNPAERRAFATRARKFVAENFSYEATTRSLIAWADNPQIAPDNVEKLRKFPDLKRFQDVALNSLEEDALLAEQTTHSEVANLRAELERVEAELAGIRSNPLYKAYKKVVK